MNDIPSLWSTCLPVSNLQLQLPVTSCWRLSLASQAGTRILFYLQSPAFIPSAASLHRQSGVSKEAKAGGQLRILALAWHTQVPGSQSQELEKQQSKQF